MKNADAKTRADIYVCEAGGGLNEREKRRRQDLNLESTRDQLSH